MTKQEEIREYLARKLLPEWVNEEDISDIRMTAEWLEASEMMAYLHSQGVVIKVDRELPERIWYKDWGGETGKAGYELALEDMADYVAVEPLVGEVKR